MGSVKLDDGFPLHPKVVGLSMEARWAYIEGLCYAARYETDGRIPDVVAANGPVREELLGAGLWERGTAAVEIHDYLVYNPSREEAKYLRDIRSAAGRASVEARVGTDVPTDVRTSAEQKLQQGSSHGGGKGGASLRSGSKTSSSRPGDTIGGGGGLGEGEEYEAFFAAFWKAYPRRVGRRKAWLALRSALKRHADPEAILAGAKRYAEDPNREDEFTAHPTTWLNRDGWDDPPLPGRSPARRPPDPPRPYDPAVAEIEIERARQHG